MNLKSRKKGITVAMAATMILIIALMTTTITIAVAKTVKGSNLKAFATELSLVQATIQEYSFTGSINEYLAENVTLTLTSTEQFSGETIDNNSVLLHVLDLEKMGIEKSVYGTGKEGSEDYYAVSLDTMKVYYIAGYDDGDKVYYTLTDELTKLLSGENTATHTNNVIFKANTVEWTNKPVTVKVLVPTKIATSSVTISTNNENIAISSFTLNGEYNEYNVNTGNADGNFVITVKYTIDGESKTETYTVSNFDNEAPVILMGNILNNNNTFYLNNVRAIDNGRVKSVKYVEIDVAESDAKSFFEAGGNDLVGEKVKLTSIDAEFTIYAEDYAGNYTTSVVTVPDNFYYVGGTKDTGLVISDNSADEEKGVDYTCEGNQFVWVPVDDYSKFIRGSAEKNSDGVYKMTGTLSTSYTEPYTSNDWEVEEYTEMCASVERYGGFYIARFEAGDGDATEARNGETEAHTVVSKKGAYIYNYVTWGTSMTSIGTEGAVYLSQNMYKDSTSVVSTLCYGVQWDTVLNFVSDADHPIDGSDTVSYSWSSGSWDVTGLSEKARTKNIYDIAGDCETWTMESFGSYRVVRSGYYYDGDSHRQAAYRYWTTVTSTGFPGIGNYIAFRPTLYVKVPEKQIVIPKGFYYVGGTEDSGFVISDNSADENMGVDYKCVGNQFVWVPVEDYSKFVRGTAVKNSDGVYKMTGALDSNYVEPDIYNGYSSEADEYYKMKDSVRKYGGFYIARFEAGNENDVVVSKKGVTVYTAKWGDHMSSVGTTGAVYLAQNMYKNSESVVSTLCYGVQWDAALNYISDAEHNIVDSSSWGNYSASTGKAATNCGSLQKTGTNEAWQAKNIYDLAGNVVEWTMESGVDDDLVDTGGELVRVLRGGKYNDTTMSSSSRVGKDASASFSVWDVSARAWKVVSGFRVALYLK